MDINICFKLRPCYVNGKKMLFHMWGTSRNGTTTAIVEDSSGAVMTVSPLDIGFADELFKDYMFEDGDNK